MNLNHDSRTCTNIGQEENQGLAMAMNPIQFQRGLSLPDFMTQYGSLEQCHRALVTPSMAERLRLSAVW